MRTTVDLPEALHRVARSLAQHSGRTLSQTIADLVEKGLSAQTPGPATPRGRPSFRVNAVTGLPVARSPRVVTPDDVASLDDSA